MSLKQRSSRDEKRILREVRQQHVPHNDPSTRRKGYAKSPYMSSKFAQPHEPLKYPKVATEQQSLPPREQHGRSQRSPLVRPQKGIAPVHRKRKRHWVRRIVIGTFLLITASAGVFGYKILAAGNKISVAEQSIFGQLRDLLFSSGEFLAGEQDGHINILLIAIGGEGHKGEDLADTIMIASIHPNNNQVALLSIPRDLYVQVPGEEYYTKINAVHAYGESQKKGYGPTVLQKKVEEITGLPIHYYGRVDFTAFKSIVDAIGGITISIENSFFDYWHKISFPAGTEKMNGERALAYVRARFIEGPEGGDFKRATRQQQVLVALREKVFSVNTAFDFRTANTILNSLSENIRTDMQLWEMKRFFEMARLIDQRNVRSVVLTSGPDGVLAGGTEVLGGVPASVLQPRTGDYSEIQAIAQNMFSDNVSTTLQPGIEASPEETREQETEEQRGEDTETPSMPSIEVRNGTNMTGLAKKTAEALETKGYRIVAVSNASNRATPATTIYALSTEATEGVKTVGDLLRAKTDSGLPEGEEESTADILIILGEDTE